MENYLREPYPTLLVTPASLKVQLLSTPMKMVSGWLRHLNGKVYATWIDWLQPSLPPELSQIQMA